jgi:hypothetical protein
MSLANKMINEEICISAEIKTTRRGRIALCSEGLGGVKLEGIEMMNIPSENICIGSYSFSSGHFGRDYEIDLEKMHACDYCWKTKKVD